ncbi:MAG TPA: 4-alpha-glucanotransferase [Bryobacteraceae bacterium]|nr:4-alpha-glucanotransferase [Bryobacteraceae bacterium]
MSEPEDPRQTDAWGIDRYYQDAFGEWKQTDEEARAAILRAMHAGPDLPPPADAPVLFLQPGHPACILEPGQLTLENGDTLSVESTVPANLPFGYHEFQPDTGAPPVRVIVSPGRCYLPEDWRAWGWSLQLYALRSSQSWGMGDLHDLGELARWSSEELGAGALMVNPLHAAIPATPQQPSPYYPSSRRYRNPLYLRVEDVPGADTAAGEVERLAAVGQSLNSRRLIDRDAVWQLKMEALRLIWDRSKPRSESFDHYVAREGSDVEAYATFCVLTERFGAGWMNWPAEYHRPESQAIGRFRQQNREQIRFHIWLQWLIEEQLQRSSYGCAVMQDLPIGVDPGGADMWMSQDVFATGISVGAPPDKFNTQGQDWGLPPFIPWKLRAARYEPFIQTIRATLRHAGGLRIDHVLGLFRLYWVPTGLGAARGAYVRYPADELLSIVALESYRASAFVVGEDLGTVEQGVSEKLQRTGILSYRVFWFEPDPPQNWPELALASLSTHDLPTVAGMWTGSDLEAQRKIGLKPNEKDTEASRELLARNAGVRGGDSLEEVSLKAHSALASAPSRLVTAQLDDALLVPERPNMPATTSEQWPNWCIALPETLEQIRENPRVQRIASSLKRA